MSVLVTGGTGFLGHAVLSRLAERYSVVATRRAGSDLPAVSGVDWLTQDLAAPLSGELPERVDAVIHLAQSLGYRALPDRAVDVFDVNAAATVRLLDYCRRAGGRTFTYASSGAVYGGGMRPLREADTCRPANLYGVSKLAGELAVEQFRDHLAAHALRFFFIYGPGQRDAFIPGLLGRIAEGRAVSLAGADGFQANPVFVDDAADAVVSTLELADGCTLNVAGPDTVSVRQIAELGSSFLGRPCSFVTEQPNSDLVANINAQRRVLGAPAVGFPEGLRRTVEAGRDGEAG